MKNLLSVVIVAVAVTAGAAVYNDLGPYAADSVNDGFWDVSKHAGVTVSSGSAVLTEKTAIGFIGIEGDECEVLDARVVSVGESAVFSVNTSRVSSFILVR